MTITWNSLHLSCADTAVITPHIQQILTEQGYTLFDPFGDKRTPPYADSVRLFVSPVVNGWTRIIGTITPDGSLQAALLPALSALGLTLALTLHNDGNAEIAIYADQNPADWHALEPHLKPNQTLNALQRASSAHYTPGKQSDSVIPMDVLPPEVQNMAQNLNPRHINRMFNKAMKSISKRMGSDQDAARDLLSGSQPDWTSSGGQRLRAVMACLTTPDGWMTPDFVTLRDAYQLHRRRQRKPDAALYPGDAEALAAVPDALDYTPIYGGKPT